MWDPAPVPDMTVRNAATPARVDVSRTSGILLLGDLLAIGLFVLIGEIHHAGALSNVAVVSGALTFAEFAAGWLVAGLAVGAYAADALSSWHRAAVTTGGGWLLGASLGQVIRAVVEWGPVFPTFVLVTLGVGGAFLLGWRLVAAAWI